MTVEEAIHKLEYSKKAYQTLIDEKVDSGKLVGDGVRGEWKAETSLNEVYKSMIEALDMAIKALEQTRWISVSERLPETDNENSINNYNVLLWVKNKSHPEREPQIYLGKLRHINGDNGNGNFWGIETKPCDWTIWGWSYFNEPEVVAWMPLPQPYKTKKEAKA